MMVVDEDKVSRHDRECGLKASPSSSKAQYSSTRARPGLHPIIIPCDRYKIHRFQLHILSSFSRNRKQILTVLVVYGEYRSKSAFWKYNTVRAKASLSSQGCADILPAVF
jgi:hypothetical protein